MKTTNLSKIKRDRMLKCINELKDKYSSDDNMINTLNEISNELKARKYGLLWEEHEERVDKELENSIPIFLEDHQKKIKSSSELKYNFLIEGDNLHSLYLLEKTHKNKIDVILIDPPYNTEQKEFIYDDTKIGSDDAYRHSKWLSFMNRRLSIAKKLLSKNGLIFIHIDDNEQANLKLLCDEIFDESNFVNCIAIKMSEATGLKMAHVNKRLPKLKEYILVYKKGSPNLKNIQIPKETWDEEYKILIKNVTEEELQIVKDILYSDESDSEDIKIADEICKKMEFSNVNELFSSNMTEEDKLQVKYDNAWRIVRDVSTTGSAKKLADEKRKLGYNAFLIVTPKNKKYLIKNGYNNSTSQPRIKLLFADNYLTTNPCDFWQDIKTTGLDNEGFVEFKNGKKPLKAEKRIIELANNKNAIVLDFFAGSGSTGQAVLELNKEDGGNRRFILCTNNEVAQDIEWNFLKEKGLIDSIPSKRNKKAYNEFLEKYEVLKSTSNYKKIVKSEEFQNLGICRSKAYLRLKTTITGETNYEGIPANLKYFKTSRIPKLNDDDNNLSDNLLKDIKTLIELENAIEIDNIKIFVAFSEKELDEFFESEHINTCERIYISPDVLITEKQARICKKNNIAVNIIPRYYFENEIKEVS